MKENIIVLSANVYDIPASANQGANSGVTVNYIMADNLEPKVTSKNSLGCRAGKQSLEVDTFANFINVPGYYEGEFEVQINSAGAATFKLKDVTYLGSLKTTFEPVSKAKV